MNGHVNTGAEIVNFFTRPLQQKENKNVINNLSYLNKQY
jgi:hypothetical protein